MCGMQVKLGFGGEVRLFPGAYDYVYNPFLRWGYNTIFSKISQMPVVENIMNYVRTVSN